jgi:hypothetical protein
MVGYDETSAIHPAVSRQWRRFCRIASAAAALTWRDDIVAAKEISNSAISSKTGDPDEVSGGGWEGGWNFFTSS